MAQLKALYLGYSVTYACSHVNYTRSKDSRTTTNEQLYGTISSTHEQCTRHIRQLRPYGLATGYHTPISALSVTPMGAKPGEERGEVLRQWSV